MGLGEKTASHDQIGRYHMGLGEKTASRSVLGRTVCDIVLAGRLIKVSSPSSSFKKLPVYEIVLIVWAIA